ncbi:MAG: tetratricopeptide repeat protein [Treponema sp.]|jgi:tetratricopeptide (TPR) repeat protein|nr:tetratricopeptide repeat protein [Treponema sp.]
MLQDGIRLFNQRNWDDALRELKQVHIGNESTEAIELAYYLGLCYAKLKYYDEALLCLEQVVSDGKNTLRVHQCRLTLAYIYVITNRTKLALFELERIQNSGSEDARLYTILGFAAWMEKEYDQALDYYRKAIKLDDQNTTAINGLGYILVDTNKNLEQGTSLCKLAVNRSPQNAAYLDSLGWAYFKKGDTHEANVWLRKALDAAPRLQQKEIRNHIKTVAGV